MSIICRTNERETLFQCEGFLDMQIGMELLVIDWAKEEPKMAKIIQFNNSIFKSIMQYFFSQINSAEGVLPNDEF